jgi:hypothetical protein
LSGLSNRRLGRLSLTFPATVLVLVAVAFETGATVTGSLIVFARLARLPGGFSLVLAVAIVTVGMIAWAYYPFECQLPTRESARFLVLPGSTL